MTRDSDVELLLSRVASGDFGLASSFLAPAGSFGIPADFE